MASGIQKFIHDYGLYLNDIWRRIYYIALFFAAISLIGFFSAGWIIKDFINFFHLANVTIVVTSPFQFLDVSVDIGLFLAMMITTPFAIWNFYNFLRPAVSRSEFRTMLLTLPVSFGLFLVGFAYGFFSLYWALEIMAGVNVSFGLKNLWDIGLFLSQLTVTASLLGVIFQLPIIMIGLMRFGILKRQALIKKRRLAYAIIIIVVSLLPPTDGVSLIVMSLPLVFLYEFAIIWDRFSKNKSLLVERDSLFNANNNN